MFVRIVEHTAHQQGYVSYTLNYTVDELKQQVRGIAPWDIAQ